MFYKHQKEIIDDDPKKAGIFLGVGGGKTRVCLSLAKGKTLVIAPKTQFQDKNWEKEVEKMGISIDLTVISKETFRRDWNIISGCETVILDESHVMCGATPNIVWKNRKPIPKTSQLFKAVLNYIDKYNPERIYLATGTPTRSPMAVWAAAKILGRDWDFYEFRDKYYFKLPMPGRNIFSIINNKETKTRLADTVNGLGYVGRLEDWFDVPNQIFKTVKLNISTEQKRYIKNIKDEDINPLITFQKIDQVENGILIGDEYTENKRFKSEKVEAILDYAEEFKQILIFVKYTEQINYIKDSLEKAKKKVLILNGATKDKGEVITEAQNSPECIVIAQSQISSGYELPSYECVIFASMSGSQVDLVQGIGRVQRLNNIKKNIYIYLVTKGGADEAKFKALMEKKDFHEHIYVKQNLL